ncbi:hypothetical protein VPH35_023018 [Triticum aestivum]
MGSSSASDEGAGALELQPVRGRSPACQGSPRAAHRRSQESLTPPVSPPLSPTSVLPRLACSRRDEARAVTAPLAVPSPTVLQLCSPTHLLPPLSPVKPPEFEASPTPPPPPLISNGPLQRTPSPVRLRRAATDLQPAGVGLTVLFEDRQEPLLPSPASTPPRPPAMRRKTLAGVNIARTSAGLSLHRTSARLKATGRARVVPAPAAKAAEILVARSLGIFKDGEDITAKALDAFAERFKEQLPLEVISAMRDLFRLDDVQAMGVEDALIQHGGEGAMDMERMEDAAAALQAST